MTIPVELAITIMAAIAAGVAWNIHRQESIWKCVSEIRENFVKKTDCKERREECPCVRDISRLTQEVDLQTTKHDRWVKSIK